MPRSHFDQAKQKILRLLKQLHLPADPIALVETKDKGGRGTIAALAGHALLNIDMIEGFGLRYYDDQPEEREVIKQTASLGVYIGVLTQSMLEQSARHRRASIAGAAGNQSKRSRRTRADQIIAAESSTLLHGMSLSKTAIARILIERHPELQELKPDTLRRRIPKKVVRTLSVRPAVSKKLSAR